MESERSHRQNSRSTKTEEIERTEAEKCQRKGVSSSEDYKPRREWSSENMTQTRN